jgi:predicted PurR-regulated permease PerM
MYGIGGLGLGGYLLLPTFIAQAQQLASSLPDAFSQLLERARDLLTPLVMHRAVSLHPAVVIASVTVFGAAFGVLGALLAVPACVVGGVLVRRLWFERLEDGPAWEPG